MTTWSGNLTQVFSQKLCKLWGTPDIDLFASRLNAQLPVYFAWKPDPGATAIDAFAENWGGKLMYTFPPFNLVARVIKKILSDQAEAIVVVPYWPTQSWFPKFANMCTHAPVILFSRTRDNMRHPW